jgi:hypothetical protein
MSETRKLVAILVADVVGNNPARRSGNPGYERAHYGG